MARIPLAASDVLAQNSGGNENPLMAAGEQIPAWTQAVDSIHAILGELPTYPTSFLPTIQEAAMNLVRGTSRLIPAEEQGQPGRKQVNAGGTLTDIMDWGTNDVSMNLLRQERGGPDARGAPGRGTTQKGRRAATDAVVCSPSTWQSRSRERGRKAVLYYTLRRKSI